MEEEIDLNHYFEKIYQDRGKIKWSGFYLAEHTEEMMDHTNSQKITRQRLMNEEEINEVLTDAFLKHHYLSVQKANDFTYFRGYVTAYDDQSITLGSKVLAYEDIRFVEKVHFDKW